MKRKRLTAEEINKRTQLKSEGALEFIGYLDEEKKSKDSEGVFKHSCGQVFYRTIGNVIHNGVISCPKCDPSKFSRTQAVLEDKLLERGYKFLSGGTRDRDFCNISHLGCGCEATHLVGSLLSKLNPKCQNHTEGYRTNVTAEDIEAELKSFEFGSFKLVSLFVNKSRPFSVECTKCGFTKEISNFSILQSRAGKCWECFGSVKSIKEEFVAICLTDLGAPFEREFKLDRFRYDFLLKGTNTLVEYDGKQHQTGKWLGKDIQLHDHLKDDVAKESGYVVERISANDSIIKRLVQIVESSTTLPQGSTLK